MKALEIESQTDQAPLARSGQFPTQGELAERLSHIMFYVNEKFKLANPLVKLAVVSYTEQWSAWLQ